MIDLETSFAALLNRQPSEKEVRQLYRVRDALNIADNDALWVVLIALESYDTLFRKYPEQIAQEMAAAVTEQKALLGSIAQAEAQKALGSLAESVSRTSHALANRVAESSRLQAQGWSMLGFLGFGGLCLLVGFILGSGRVPYWYESAASSLPSALLGTLARTPAGWIAAIAGSVAASGSLWRSWPEVKAGQRPGLLLGAVSLWALSFAFLVPILGS